MQEPRGSRPMLAEGCALVGALGPRYPAQPVSGAGPRVWRAEQPAADYLQQRGAGELLPARRPHSPPPPRHQPRLGGPRALACASRGRALRRGRQGARGRRGWAAGSPSSRTVRRREAPASAAPARASSLALQAGTARRSHPAAAAPSAPGSGRRSGSSGGSRRQRDGPPPAPLGSAGLWRQPRREGAEPWPMGERARTRSSSCEP